MPVKLDDLPSLKITYWELNTPKFDSINEANGNTAISIVKSKVYSEPSQTSKTELLQKQLTA